MIIGKKIKQHRQLLKMTQAELAGDKLTRNMISSIESGKALPSLETLEYVAERLELPSAYLLSEDDDLFFYQKRERIGAIKNALDEKNYTVCINLILKLERTDDELLLILATCYFELGIQGVMHGSLQTALTYLQLALQYSAKTVYDTKRIETIAPVYMAVAENVNSPLLEFDPKEYYSKLIDTADLEFCNYVILNPDYLFTYPPYLKHMKAKSLIKERRYMDAVTLLLEIDEERNEFGYNAYLLYGVYTDLDTCYRQLADFENAYRYSSKRISLLEGFRS